MITEIHHCLPAFLPAHGCQTLAAHQAQRVLSKQAKDAAWEQLCFAILSPGSRDKLARFSPWDSHEQRGLLALLDGLWLFSWTETNSNLPIM